MSGVNGNALPPVAESVVPLYESPEPIRSVCTTPVPFPLSIPERVVEPVPPMFTLSVEEAETTPFVPTSGPESEPIVTPPLNVLRPVNVFTSARSVEDAAVPASAESVVPLYVSPEPTINELTPPVPFPLRIPVSVVEPVPPYATPSEEVATTTPLLFVVRSAFKSDVVMVPVFETEKSVEVAEAVDEPIAKRVFTFAIDDP